MAYIAPNTDIVLCKNVPLDATKAHTVYFSTPQAQWDYFYSKRFKVLNVNSYQRTMRNRLRIQCSIDEAMQCNYLYFNNSNYEQKFIYCFITGWEYINNVTTEITYKVDVMQTFFPYMNVGMCFVEREHSVQDYPTNNTVPENLEVGELVANDSGVIALTGASPCVVFYTNFLDQTGFPDFQGDYANGVMSGLAAIPKSYPTAALDFIQRVVQANKWDGVFAAYMCPFTPDANNYRDIVHQTKSIAKYGNSLDGYYPRNQKLFTYPYNMLHIQTDVDSADFDYELFRDVSNQCTFSLLATWIPEPAIALVPTNYAGYTGTTGGQYRLSLNCFPQVALNADTWKVYLAQNAASLPTKLISQAAQTAIQIGGAVATGGASLGAMALAGTGQTAVGNPIDYSQARVPDNYVNGFEVVNSASGILQSLAQIHDIRTKPPQQKGTQSAMSDWGIGYKNFIASRLSCKAEMARKIDQYFDMYGYATHEVKYPNINSRPHWNYVQTKGFMCWGDAPQPFIQEICKIFDNGITFWKNPTEIGNYSLDNSPT